MLFSLKDDGLEEMGKQQITDIIEISKCPDMMHKTCSHPESGMQVLPMPDLQLFPFVLKLEQRKEISKQPLENRKLLGLSPDLKNEFKLVKYT